MAKSDIISRLRLESGEFDSKIKRAGQELLAYSEHCRKMSQTMGYANRDAKDFAKALGSMATVSQTARGKINELSEAFVNAKVMYKNMTDAEKQGEFGKNLAASLDQLKSRLNSAKQDLADVNKELSVGGKFGEFGNIIDTLGSKMGVTGSLTEMLTSKTALLTAGIGASIAVIAKATEAWTAYNSELAKQDQQTKVITGLKGDDAERMTDSIRAMVDTYNVDFRQAVEAANTLMSQFGVDGDQAIQLLRDGLQGMIMGDGPKLLSMIQQYAPAFHDAGVSASQLVAVIQNSEGGIFTDQNMNAIVFGIKNIRLMTKATSDALAQLGIDGGKMSEQLSDGSLTIFEALKQVASAIEGVDSNSKAAGEVMQAVFGRQGAMAGTNLGKAIATLNTNLEETKHQTGEVGAAYNDLQQANERLNKAIRECFGYDGWDKMSTGIKTKLVDALSRVLEITISIKESWVGDVGRTIFDTVSDAATKALGPLSLVLQALKLIRRESDGNAGDAAALGGGIGKVVTPPTQTNPLPEVVVTGNKNKQKSNQPKAAKTEKTEIQRNDETIAKLTQEYQHLATTAQKADNAQQAGLSERMALINVEIVKLQERNDELKKFADEAKTVKYPTGSLPQLTKELQDLQKAQSKALTGDDWQAYQRAIEQTQRKVDVLKGKWQEGMQATFSLNTTVPSVSDMSATVTFKADDADVLAKAREIEGVTIDEKTLTVTANTADAIYAIEQIEGMAIHPKDVTFKADDADVLDKVRGIEGATIDEKTLTVTANTQQAYNRLNELLKDYDGKQVTFSVKPKMEVGTSVQNNAGLSAYIGSLKQQLEKADYGTSLYNGLSSALVDTTMLQNLVRESLKVGLGTAMFDAADETGTDFWTRAMEGSVDNVDWQAIADKINERRKQMKLEAISLDFTTGGVSEKKDDENLMEKSQKLVSGLSSVSSGLNQVGVKLPEGVTKILGGIQGLMSIIQGVQTVVSVFSTSTATAQLAATTANTAMIAANTTALASLTAAVWANTAVPSFFAGGGTVGHAASGLLVGNSYSGDNVRLPLASGRGMIGVNDGELILNRAQQGVLADELEQGSGGGGTATSPYVNGQTIFLGTNNYLKASGQGEIVTTKMLKRYGLV